MAGYEAATSWLDWLYKWQSLVGSAFTGLVAVAALIWAARQFIAADKQAATAAARALRDQLTEYEQFLNSLDKARALASAIFRYGELMLNVESAAASELATQIDGSRWELNEHSLKLKERSNFVQSPAQLGFEKAASDLFNVSQIAVWQLETHAEKSRQVRGVLIPNFPNETAAKLDQLTESLLTQSVDLRLEILDDMRRTRRMISRYMQKVVGS